jgi:hypothetical protein
MEYSILSVQQRLEVLMIYAGHERGLEISCLLRIEPGMFCRGEYMYLDLEAGSRVGRC